MTVEIKNLQKKYTVNQRVIRKKAEAILSLCGLEGVELSLLFVNNQRIRALNKRYRGIDKPTDVLAFPMEENIPPPLYPLPTTHCIGLSAAMGTTEGRSRSVSISPLHRWGRGRVRKGRVKKGTQPRLLGDIVISMEKTHSQARERGHLPAREILILLTHGILHLIGYDHERSPREARRMKRKESFILKKVQGVE